MTILGHNLGQNSPPTQVTMGDLGECVNQIRTSVDGALEKMREQERILIKKNKIIREVILLCKKLGIWKFVEILKKTNNINAKDSLGGTILENTVGIYYIDIFKILITHPDILVNEKSGDGSTVLMRAMYFGSVQATKLLLAHPDILVNEKNNDEETALTMASRGGKIQTIEILFSDPKLNLLEHDQGIRAIKYAGDSETRRFIKRKIRGRGMDV